MKKIAFILVVIAVLLAGCVDQQANRQSLEDRFRAAYPDSWQQALLEYDIEQERLADERRAKQHRAHILSQGKNTTVEVDLE